MRIAVLFLSSALLWFAASQANHYLAPLQLSLFLGGLFVAYPALHVSGRAGGVTVFLAGLLLDATAPVWPGTHALLFLAAFHGIRNMRDRLPRDDGAIRVLVALLANLGLFLFIAFIRVPHFPDYTSAWLRLLVDLVASQAAIALIGPWFFALQQRALILSRGEHVPLG